MGYRLKRKKQMIKGARKTAGQKTLYFLMLFFMEHLRSRQKSEKITGSADMISMLTKTKAVPLLPAAGQPLCYDRYPVSNRLCRYMMSSRLFDGDGVIGDQLAKFIDGCSNSCVKIHGSVVHDLLSYIVADAGDVVIVS